MNEMVPENVWQGAIKLHAPKCADQARRELDHLFPLRGEVRPFGIGHLPAAWLASLPKLLQRLKPRSWPDCLPFGLSELNENQGIVEVQFVDENALGFARHGQRVADLIRAALNLGMYPTRYRPLTRRDSGVLYAKHPHLRLFLQNLPAVAEL